jgi:methionyl-tRNA synthetase
MEQTQHLKQNPILLTTAISYTNGKPHIGHLYESVLADFIKNVFIILDHPTKLLTGTDEHGKKIQETAIGEKTEPIEICNKYSLLFKQMNNNIQMSYDHFIRTTDESHKQFVSESILKSVTNSDIYLSEYEGWYDVKEETYINETEAKINNYTNPLTGKLYERVKEETYMFKLKKYEEVVKKLLSCKQWIIPNSYAGEQIKRIWQENGVDSIDSTTDQTNKLIDLSITRTTFDWGIKFPQLDDVSKMHVIYVWFDALLNYISGRNLLYANNSTQNQPLQTYHLIGKDIIWFHSVIYPAILSSIGEPLPNSILVHGFVLDENGRKMSKSLGNVVDVDYLLTKYSAEAIRYYLINETVFGSDILFSEANLIATYNNILIKNFGNLWQRMYNLLRPIESELNEWISANQLKITTFKQNIYNQISEFKTDFDFVAYKSQMYDLLAYTNKELTEKMPWKIPSDTEINIQTKIEIFADVFLHFNCACGLIYPIIPNKVLQLVSYFNWDLKQLKLTCSDINFKFMSDEKKIIAFDRI